ncbi:putative helicase MOV-10 [Lingula anatina]|uniref:RNA helicase n=1 Tax=Lingula anatina TaxID=7574 RepID=A0A1S3JER6_LINAN|nr:putative helicase MOV-10 [Lingula anatina]|eukprot:XP_013408833.1 putative helicase MOV-10 [Lingula anatina]
MAAAPRGRGGRATLHELQQVGVDFLDYLNLQGIAGSVPKGLLKDIFNNQYKPYVAQRNSEGGGQQLRVRNFSTVLFALKIHRHVHKTNGMIVLQPGSDQGGRANSRSKKRRKNQKSRIAARFPEPGEDPKRSTATPDNEEGPMSRRKQGKKGRLAVDQFISLSAKSKDSPNVSEKKSEDSPTKQNKFHLCQICKVNCCTELELEKHSKGKRHRVQSLVYNLRANRDQYISDKFDITITSTVELIKGCYKFDLTEKVTTEINLTIKNMSTSESVILEHCEMLKRLRVFSLSDPGRVTDGIATKTILAGDSYNITVRAKAPYVGIYRVPVAFHFKRPNSPTENIHIIRYLCAWCQNDDICQLQPTAPFRRPPRVALGRQGTEIIDGLPVPKDGREELEREIELGPYPIPPVLRRLMNRGLEATGNMSLEDRTELDNLIENLEGQLNFQTHRRRFASLLHMEEAQMEVDIRKYDMEAETMTISNTNPRLLVLKVPGLAENRPSILKGDWLFVREYKSNGQLEDREYKGYVHQVMLNEVALGFSNKLLENFIPGKKFSVRFTFGRLPLRVQHRAVALADEHSLEDLLFPVAERACKWGTIIPVDSDLRFYDRQLESNAEQRQAVVHIVAGTSRPVPYLIFGPPGTGKTVTLVEALKQVVKCIPSSHILACAPSNSATDLIAHRLLKHLPKKQVLRMHAFSRDWRDLPDDLRECSNYDPGRKQYFYPKKSELMKYKVVVCTLVTAGRIASANFPPGHFTHIFIDEAGHAVEPEGLIALAGILECDVKSKDGGQVVLAGDPKQLGPILRSPLAIKYGLGLSLLERYMTYCDVYKKRGGSSPGSDDDDQDVLYKREGHYNPFLLTKLLKNYRSHPAILKLPNEQFYDNELEACADRLARESLCNWEGLPKTGCPFVFHGVVGEDMREERSPSFFNPEEATIVLGYVEKLLEARGIRVLQNEIGIISPYRKQVQKLRQLLFKKNFRDIKVGSVEEFQGQERRVIMVSTVRSNPNYLAMDAEFKLGFLKNPKRFNVSITRAKALLIVVGNPFLLSQDEHWNSFLKYCLENQAYTGCDYDDPTDQLDDVVERFAAVNIKQSDVTMDVSQIQLQEDPEWRGEA